jgi:hypothetical protein
MSSQYSKLSAAARTAIDAIVAKYPNRCGRDLLQAAAKAAEAVGDDLQHDESSMYIFLKHRPDCGVDCDEQCPVTGKPCYN